MNRLTVYLHKNFSIEEVVHNGAYIVHRYWGDKVSIWLAPKPELKYLEYTLEEVIEAELELYRLTMEAERNYLAKRKRKTIKELG